MPALQVRDLPHDTYERLVRCASEEHRSLAQQTVAILEKYLSQWESETSVRLNSAATQGAVEMTQSASAPNSRSTDRVNPPFTPFKDNGITYLTRPDETQAQRSTRKKELLANINLKSESYADLPPAGDITQQMRTERLAQLVPEAGDAAWW